MFVSGGFLRNDTCQDTYGNLQLIKDLAEQLHLLLHLILALFPETLLVCLLEGDCGRLLERGHTAVTDTGVCSSDVLDQMLGSDQVAYAPSGGVEGLACRSHGKRALIKFGGKSRDSGIRNIEQAVVYLIRQDDEIILHAQIANALELFSGEHLAYGVVR
jgi:hypothetical protein